MKRLLTLAALAIFVVVSQNATAQLKKFRIGLGIEGALPTGDMSNLYTVGGGLTARFEIRPLHNLAFNATAGAMIFSPKDISGINTKPMLNIPVKLGVKYIFVGHLYGMLELGNTTSHIYYYQSSNNSLQQATSNNFTIAPGIGVQLIGFDIGLRYESFGSNHFTGLRLGFGI